MNINISFKPVTSFFRKYTSLLPCIAITFVALLLFFPIMMIGGSVKKNMAASLNTARQVQAEISNVPTRDKAQQTKEFMDKLEQDASEIEKLALQSCQRDLVTYDHVIFPKPLDSSSQVFYEFGRRYRVSIEELLKTIKAMDAPTDSEIGNRLGASALRGGMPGRGFRGRGGFTDMQDSRLDDFFLSRAKEISVYAHPTAFQWYSFWEKYEFAGENQALQDCWDAQVALWVYQDIIETIYKMNGTNSNVDESAVKRLLGVSFSGPVNISSQSGNNYQMAIMMGTSNAADRDIPNYITPKLSSNFVGSSPTGRACNEAWDIIHFAVSVVVDSRSALAFMKELCSEKNHSYHVGFADSGEIVENARHNQITILQTDAQVVDPRSQEHYKYRYGKGGAMQLDLVCEYQFYRKSYDSIKPEPIQQRLDLTDTGNSSTPGAAPAAPPAPSSDVVF